MVRELLRICVNSSIINKLTVAVQQADYLAVQQAVCQTIKKVGDRNLKSGLIFCQTLGLVFIIFSLAAICYLEFWRNISKIGTFYYNIRTFNINCSM